MTYIPNELYEVYFHKHDGSLHLVLTKWNRLEFSQRVNNPWNHIIELVLSKDDPLGSILRALKRDYIVYIYRTDSLTGERTRVYEGLHGTVYEQLRTDGNIYFGLYGSGFTKFLERREVFPDVRLENSQKDGPAESVIKEYVYESAVNPTTFTINFGAGATTKTFTILGNTRRLSGLVIAPDLGAGETVDYSARFTKLDSVLSTLAEQGGVYYGIYESPSFGNFIFDCKAVWGIDRRVDNTEGNTPYIFSVELGNMVLPILSSNARYESNFMIVGGSGQGLKRQLYVVSDYESIVESPWGLSEFFVEARKTDSAEGLSTIGKKALKDRGRQHTLEFEISQDRFMHRWPEAWGLGDLVTAYYMGERFDKRINEVHVSVSSSGTATEQISVELEDV